MSKALIAAWYKYRRVAWLGEETIEDNLRRAFEAGWWACEEQGGGATLKAQGPPHGSWIAVPRQPSGQP